MEQMYPLHIMEFLALSVHPYDPEEWFDPLPAGLLRTDAICLLEDIRNRCIWTLVQTKEGLRRVARPRPQDLFRQALRQRLPDTPKHECRG